jgi:hypothetical protein
MAGPDTPEIAVAADAEIAIARVQPADRLEAVQITTRRRTGRLRLGSLTASSY